MIYHLFDASMSHLVPNITRGILDNATLTNRNGIDDIYILLWFPEKTIFDSKQAELIKYYEFFNNYSFSQFTIIDDSFSFIGVIYSIGFRDKLVIHSNFTIFGFYPAFLLALALRGKTFLKKVIHIEWGVNINGKTGILSWLKNKIKSYNYNRYGYVVALTTEDKKSIKEKYSEANVVQINYILSSNIFNHAPKNILKYEKLKILVSHSGHLHNNHFKTFDLLEKFSNRNLEILCPLAYGPVEYIEKVINYGKFKFGPKFNYFTELMPLDRYVKLIADHDIYITSSEIQTGLFAAFTALSNGLKVYLGFNLYRFMDEAGFVLFNVEEIKNSDYGTFRRILSQQEFHKNQEVFKNLTKNEVVAEAWRNIYS